MKVKLIPTLIIAGISMLAGYGFYSANRYDSGYGCWIMMVVSAIALFVTLAGGFCLQYPKGGVAVGIVALSIFFTIIQLIINLAATFFMFMTAPYIVFSGIFLLIFVGIVYALSKSL